MLRIASIVAAFSLAASTAFAQSPAQQAQQQVTNLGNALAAQIKDSSLPAGQVNATLEALLAAWHETADGTYFSALQTGVDHALAAHQPLPSEAALACFRVTAKPVYKTAVEAAYNQPVAAGDETFRSEFAITFDRQNDLSALVRRLSHEPATAQKLAALDDILKLLPAKSPERAELLSQARETATALESSKQKDQLTSYALAKGARLNLLPAADEHIALHRWNGVNGHQADDLLAATEVAQSDTALRDRGKLVLVDAWFNSQTRPSPSGGTELFHYKFDDDQNSGFSFFGRAFQRYGAQLGELPAAPTATSLAPAKVYIIASPDIPSKNPHPHYMDPASVTTIEHWVRNGGVLLLMENDKNSSEFTHFNTLSERFGIHFNAVLRNEVEGHHFEQGRLDLPAGTGGIFPQPLQVYMKEICTITTSGPAKSVFTDKGDTLMAIAHLGKGTVYAVVDPWLYNEYTDGRKLPADYKNFTAAIQLAGWSLAQSH